MDLLIVKVLRWSIISMMIVEVICNTKSTNVCQENSDVLQVKIETGDELFAGTNSHVSLILRSGNGVICQVYDLDNIGNDRERNSVDEYTICCSKDFFNDDDDELSMLAVAKLTRSGKVIPFFSDD
ncbi:unnamed protein product [Rotaria sp. Silwood1]|nr:unnamed protein product [Rotaria sp. Silwood1]CAF3578680.1 unnamed protein product [Rotaria sp. Silwood1]CAF3620658.1 unnamed protein product [Rotaria sp. Silwood1]CAF4667845.1 unnamed protein product [Rotaria sp. Silwood1]CAF4949951.1 unnamed protein product [Rotaria sp. Silwood1]